MFAIMQPETVPQTGLVAVPNKFPAPGGGFATSAGSGVATGIGNMAIIVDFSGIQWGTAPYANMLQTSLRDDLSYTMQAYSAVGFGGMRIDDLKVIILLYK